MSPEVTNLFLDVAANTPFIAFLLYNWYDTKRLNERYRMEMKEHADKHMSALEALRKEGKTEEAELRQRYQVVIDDLSKDREKMTNLFSEKIRELESKIVSLEKAVKKLFALFGDVQKVKDELIEIKIKDKVRNNG